MDKALRVTIGGSAFSENASPARTDANRRRRKLRLPRGIRRSQAASGDQLTERVEDNAFHLTRSATSGYSKQLGGNSHTLVRVRRVWVRPEVSERHRHLVRTGLSARVAYFIGVAGMATAAG
jgi:hypothetical protein